jgi:hypothetical protein
MGQVVSTSGDYTIKSGVGSTVTIDTGPGVGNLLVTGNLLITGQALNVDTTNLNIKDNLIELNSGETGAGVTLRWSGLQVDRGSLAPASILFDETTQTWNIAQGVAGTVLNFSNSKLKLRTITTNTTTDSGDLTLDTNTGFGVVKITGSSAYTTQVLNRLDDAVLTNKGYVDYAIQNSPSFQITATDTRVIATDKNVTGSLQYIIDNTGYSTFSESAVSVIIDGVLASQFYKNRVIIQDLEFNDNEITNNFTNGNISLRTQGTGKVQTNYAIELDNIAATPATVANATLVYGSDVSGGGTGLYFANTSYVGEVISKNRAFILSMIF